MNEVPSVRRAAAGRPRRVWALIRKEVRQVIRDPSSIAIGIVMPVVLILLFGFGMSLDVTDVPVALVLEDSSPASTDLASSFELSPYFAAQRTTSMRRQNSRRANGSAPLVGSSRNNVSGSCISAAAMARRRW